MSLETDLYDALKSLVGNRVSPVIFPQANQLPTWPAIRYTIISSVPVVDLCGDGDDLTADVRVQLDVVAETYKAVRALRLQVLTAMASFSPPAILQDSTNSWDAETKTYREIIDYIVYGSSPSGNSPP